MAPVLPSAPAAPTALQARWGALGYHSDERIGFALERSVAQRPEAEAVLFDGVRLTYRELGRRADAIAAQLLASGVGRGDVVTWMLPNCIEAVAAAAAIWRIGAISNPIVTIYRQREVEFIAGQLRPAAVITARDVRGRDLVEEMQAALDHLGHRPVVRLVVGRPQAGWTVLASEPSTASLARVEPASAEAACLVMYTSGTTAEPKGVVHSSQSLLHEARSMRDVWGLSWRDTMLMAAPLAHITGLTLGLLVPCLLGARTVLMDRWDPERCRELVEQESATYMAGATPFLQGLLAAYADAKMERTSLRQFCCGGSSVPPHLIVRAAELGMGAYRCWGMSEFPSVALGSERDPLDKRSTTDGLIGPGAEVQAVDESRRPLGVGREGELRVRGPEQMLGYVDARQTAAAVDQDGWLYTGDVGIVDEQGYVAITGRTKDIINRGGEKFSTREIEDLLAAHPRVVAVAVVPLPEERLGERVCAAVVTRDGADLDVSEVREFLIAQRLAPQKIPEVVTVVGQLPATPAGKIQKHVLAARLQAGIASVAANRRSQESART